ncbi:3989_t:CDS:1, partial [Funneliformis mosseae]
TPEDKYATIHNGRHTAAGFTNLGNTDSKSQNFIRLSKVAMSYPYQHTEEEDTTIPQEGESPQAL